MFNRFSPTTVYQRFPRFYITSLSPRLLVPACQLLKKEILTVVHTCSKTEFSIPSHQTERLRKKKTTLKFFFFPFPSPYYHLPFKLYTSGDIISLLSRYLANQHIYLCVIPDSCRQPKKKDNFTKSRQHQQQKFFVSFYDTNRYI